MRMIQDVIVTILITMLMKWARFSCLWRWYDDGAPECYDAGDNSGGIDIMDVEYVKHDDNCGYAYGPLHAYDS